MPTQRKYLRLNRIKPKRSDFCAFGFESLFCLVPSPLGRMLGGGIPALNGHIETPSPYERKLVIANAVKQSAKIP